MSDPIQSKDINVEKCVENVGGSQFNLILLAAKRAREISNKRNLVMRNDSTVKYENRPTTEALYEIENGDITLEHLFK